MVERRKVAALKDQQKFLLWERLRGLLPEFEQEGPTLVEAAERLTKELGFRITFRNIQHALEGGIIERWKAKRGAEPAEKKATKAVLAQRLAILEERVSHLWNLVRMLCQEFDIHEEAVKEETPNG